MLGRWKLIVSITFPLEKINAICGFYVLFLDISKPNAETFSGFFAAWSILKLLCKLLKLMFNNFSFTCSECFLAYVLLVF